MVRIILVVLVLIWPLGAQADTPALTLAVGDHTASFTASGLLARRDAAEIAIPHDESYGRAERYRAVPLLALLAGLPFERFDTLEARASDGFVSQIPSALVARAASGGAVPWIAVEDPSHPWPHLDGKDVSAGPFYLVWTDPERSGVTPEQWPYALASLTAVQSPVQRWPQLALAETVPPDDPARRGLAVFITQCLPCHRLNGAGEGAIGPDLGRPMPALAYMTKPGLRALIRNPKQVRTWPQQQMPGFSAASVPDSDVDAVIGYLRAAAGP